jgi:membrane-associated phospholipid phosphatase
MRPARALAALLLALAAPAARAGELHPLRYDTKVDLSITGGALAFTLGTELAKSELAPSTCRFCGTNAFDAGARELLVLPWTDAPRHASDILVAGVIPAGVAANQLLSAKAGGDWHEGGRDLLFIAEAVSISSALNQVVKYSVGRQRPFVRYGNFEDPNRKPDPDDNLSFYSGHTSTAFALAAAAGTVSSLRGYDSTPWVWGVGMTLAASVGYFRIAADKHYLTDVLTGAAIGTATGILVPRWLHPREETGRSISGAGARSSRTQVIPIPLGVTILF